MCIGPRASELHPNPELPPPTSTWNRNHIWDQEHMHLWVNSPPVTNMCEFCTQQSFFLFRSLSKSGLQTHQTSRLFTFKLFSQPHSPWSRWCHVSLNLPLGFLKSKWVSESHCVSTGHITWHCCQGYISILHTFLPVRDAALIKRRPVSC